MTVVVCFIATVYAALGAKGQSFAYLDRAYDEHSTTGSLRGAPNTLNIYEEGEG